MAEKGKLIVMLWDAHDIKSKAPSLAENCQHEVRSLRPQLVQAKSAAYFLANQRRSKKDTAPLLKSKTKIKLLENQLIFHKCLIASIKMEQITRFPFQNLHTIQINGAQPVDPINKRTVNCTTRKGQLEKEVKRNN